VLLLAVDDFGFFDLVWGQMSHIFNNDLFALAIISILVFFVAVFFINLEPIDAITITLIPFVVYAFYSNLFVGWAIGIFIIVLGYILARGVSLFTKR